MRLLFAIPPNPQPNFNQPSLQIDQRLYNQLYPSTDPSPRIKLKRQSQTAPAASCE